MQPNDITVSNYEEIMAALNSLEEPNQKIFVSTKNIIELATTKCPRWQGIDAKEYRKELIEMTNSINGSAKWMNAICDELKNRAILLKNSEQTFKSKADLLSGEINE